MTNTNCHCCQPDANCLVPFHTPSCHIESKFRKWLSEMCMGRLRRNIALAVNSQNTCHFILAYEACVCAAFFSLSYFVHQFDVILLLLLLYVGRKLFNCFYRLEIVSSLNMAAFSNANAKYIGVVDFFDINGSKQQRRVPSNPVTFLLVRINVCGSHMQFGRWILLILCVLCLRCKYMSSRRATPAFIYTQHTKKNRFQAKCAVSQPPHGPKCRKRMARIDRRDGSECTSDRSEWIAAQEAIKQNLPRTRRKHFQSVYILHIYVCQTLSCVSGEALSQLLHHCRHTDMPAFTARTAL